MLKTSVLLIATFFAAPALAGEPYLVSPDGTYLGNLNNNQFDPNSVANPFGKYGSKFSPNSINNQFGTYGSPFSNKSPHNPYATQSPYIFSPNN